MWLFADFTALGDDDKYKIGCSYSSNIYFLTRSGQFTSASKFFTVLEIKYNNFL